ncbi:MAG: hypothetical protein IKT10_00895 [Clostridiales bacterium]|nr:hypothetical protein [Clostridiales bacterium]
MTNIFKRKASSQENSTNLSTYQDSFFSELLMSLISAITILTVMIFVQMYLADIQIGAIPPYSLLIVAVAHTFIRRSKINNIILIVILHLAVSAVFYFVALRIPALQFGAIAPNRNYLFLALTALTVFSISYRIKPVYTASDSEFIAFPAIIHVVGYILLALENSTYQDKVDKVYATPSFTDENVIARINRLNELAEARVRFTQNLFLNAMVIALLFLVMRQIAVFESRYHHSIRKESKTSALLKKQNHKTVFFIIALFALAVFMLFFFPYSALNNLLLTAARAILGGIFFLISQLKISDDYVDLDLQEIEDLTEDAAEVSEEDPLIRAVAILLLVLLIIAILAIVIKTISAYIKNMPKNTGLDESSDDDILIDTIENIAPEDDGSSGKSHDFGTGYERQVRKRFYDKTRRAIRKGLPVSGASTPGQIENVLLANGDKEISSLRQEYEKVRYGKD